MQAHDQVNVGYVAHLFTYTFKNYRVIIFSTRQKSGHGNAQDRADLFTKSWRKKWR
jgi:hypothetical protein